MGQKTLPDAIRNWLRAAFAQFPRQFCIDFWGQEQLWVGLTVSESDLPLILSIRHPGVIRALFLSQDPLVLTEAYLHDCFDFEGRIEDAIALGQHLASVSVGRGQDLRAWLQALRLPRLPLALQMAQPWQWSRSHSRDRDRAVVQHHYDVGEAFYQLWLDPKMVYSCAYFEHPQVSLQQAQEAKLDLICRKLKLSPGESLLDIGCGWGTLLRWAIAHYGVKGYGITLSQDQLTFNQRCIAAEGLEDRLQVELRDYRDLPQEAMFDKIVSVGMIEHVGLKNYPVYFQRILSALKPGGLFLNHGITASDEWNGSSIGERFINRYIFPDGDLIQLSTTLVEMEKVGWEIVDVDGWRPHYARTLRCWEANLTQAFEQASELIGHKRVQLWRLYLLGSAIGFEENQMGIYQIVARRKADLTWNLPHIRSGWLCKTLGT